MQLDMILLPFFRNIHRYFTIFVQLRFLEAQNCHPKKLSNLLAVESKTLEFQFIQEVKK